MQLPTDGEQMRTEEFESSAIRRYNTRRGIEKILEDAEERDRVERLLDLRIRFSAIRGTRIA